LFAPGIGPHSEAETVRLVVNELTQFSTSYINLRQGVPYPLLPRQKCDLCLDAEEPDGWAMEIKLLRLLGDNGKLNDNMLMHILSPYPQHRSAVTDCLKLLASGFKSRKAVIVFGYEAAEWPLTPAIDAFEALASRIAELRASPSAYFGGLRHPIHSNGRVFGWELI
jgi:hypothetical protein